MKFSLFISIFVLAFTACAPPPSDNTQPSCEFDEDCGTGNLCGLSTTGEPVCVTAESVPSNSNENGVECTSDVDCASRGPAYQCIGDTLVKHLPTCTADQCGYTMKWRSITFCNKGTCNAREGDCSFGATEIPECSSDADCDEGYRCDTSSNTHLSRCVEQEPSTSDCPTAYLAGQWKSLNNYLIDMHVQPDCTVLIDNPKSQDNPTWQYYLTIDAEGNVNFDYQNPVDGWTVTFKGFYYNEDSHTWFFHYYEETWNPYSGVPRTEEWTFMKQD